MSRSRLDAILSIFVTVHPHETSASSFFILCAYFVVLPLRDEGAISLGLSNLPSLFIGSLLFTSVAAPLATLFFSLPNVPQRQGFLVCHLLCSSFCGIRGRPLDMAHLSCRLNGRVRLIKLVGAYPIGWEKLDWFYVSVRIGLFVWIALLNLITISSIWARVIDVMDSESGSRLFEFIGAGATLGQLCGSLFATGMGFLGPFLLLCFVDGVCCTVIKRDNPGCATSPGGTNTHQRS